AATLDQLDALLWSHAPTTFIPHGRAPDPATPVTLNQGGDPGHHHGLLINLAAGAPDWFSRFERLAEFVHAENPLQREQMRDRYRFYRDRGYAIEHHKLGAPARALASCPGANRTIRKTILRRIRRNSIFRCWKYPFSPRC
ncbi:MAG TPA: DNA polymerase III subunit chi, partial [Thiobacillaceae bacterium]